MVVDYDFNLAVLHHTNAGVGCTQIDTNDSAIFSITVVHGSLVLCLYPPYQGERGNEYKEEVKEGCKLKGRSLGRSLRRHDEKLYALVFGDEDLDTFRGQVMGIGKSAEACAEQEIENGMDT